MATGGRPGLVLATATAEVGAQRAVRDQPEPFGLRNDRGGVAFAGAEHAVSNVVRHLEPPAARHRHRPLRGGRHPAQLAVGKDQDQDGGDLEDPRGPGRSGAREAVEGLRLY